MTNFIQFVLMFGEIGGVGTGIAHNKNKIPEIQKMTHAASSFSGGGRGGEISAGGMQAFEEAVALAIGVGGDDPKKQSVDSGQNTSAGQVVLATTQTPQKSQDNQPSSQPITNKEIEALKKSINDYFSNLKTAQNKNLIDSQILSQITSGQDINTRKRTLQIQETWIPAIASKDPDTFRKLQATTNKITSENAKFDAQVQKGFFSTKIKNPELAKDIISKATALVFADDTESLTSLLETGIRNIAPNILPNQIVTSASRADLTNANLDARTSQAQTRDAQARLRKARIDGQLAEQEARADVALDVYGSDEAMEMIAYAEYMKLAIRNQKLTNTHGTLTDRAYKNGHFPDDMKFKDRLKAMAIRARDKAFGGFFSESSKVGSLYGRTFANETNRGWRGALRGFFS